MLKELLSKMKPENKESDLSVSRDTAARMLKTTPGSLEAFEKAYQRIEEEYVPEDVFELNAKSASELHAGIPKPAGYPVDALIERCAMELEQNVPVIRWDGTKLSAEMYNEHALPEGYSPVTLQEINALPEHLRPQLSGNFYKKDYHDDVYKMLLDIWSRYISETDPKKRAFLYGQFRSGLDFMDLDPVMYEMLGLNPTSMGYWLPRIAEAVAANTLLKIPETTVFKVPIPILQLSRIEYASLTRTTLDIVDRVVKNICRLDDNKEYFIKTGVFSSKYDFRNCKVTGAKEVRELGEYLLFISHQASQFAAPLVQPCRYGAATTNEWVVREFIKDKENNPCIYHGLPLHTEYRVFVDFDSKEVIGVVPYWEPHVMKQRFDFEEDSGEPDMAHDSVIYRMHEETLMRRFDENKGFVESQVQSLLANDCDLTGQWSVDIMQNADDFYLIDMATACTSALREFIPGKIKQYPENWIPEIRE